MSSIAESHRQMQACWTSEQVGRAIQNTENLSSADNHYFLASHAPIRRIVDERSKQEFTEAEYFDLVFRSAHRNVQAIVYGEPGTGKSHLIHWLKLRCDDAVRTSEDFRDVQSVLIERRNGSLKGALVQIVEQLGDQFSQYLEKIHSALRQISSETARKELAGQFWLELGPRRRDRDLPPLPSDLRHLAECFVAPGFGEWLCRRGGAIDRLTSRLTEASTVEERQTTPQLTVSDFLPSPEYQRQNPPIVLDLIDQFQEDDALCREACTIANGVIREAVLGMTGLTSVDLQNVFFEIRRELARQQKRLVILVEDVSVYQALDQELVVAFEPQVHEGLCDLRVVFGMTDPGLQAIRMMPDNQIQRITYIHSLSGRETRWGDDPKELASFMGRYLNTVRLKDSQVQALAVARKDGEDVSKSACDSCPFSIRDECHKKFGAVQFEPGVEVGLFPFTLATASQWLSLYSDRTQGNVKRTPRSLLMQLMFPALEHPGNVPQNFPPASVPIPAAGVSFWTAFEEQYCGNWPIDEKRRLQRLATAWIKATSVHEAAQQLEGLREAFGFPNFTRAIDKRRQPPIEKKPDEEEPRVRPQEPPATQVSPQLQKILTAVEEWRAGAQLLEDTVPRNLLSSLIKNAVRWQDVRRIPVQESKRLLLSKDIIDIEGQRVTARLGNVHFRRSAETADLIQALARFEYQGSRSWQFEDGERFKRIVASWLRRNTEWVIDSFIPKVPDPAQPVRTACEYLAFIAATGSKKQLPTDRPAELISVLLNDPPTSDVQRVSEAGRQLVAQLRLKHRSIRDWLAEELNVPQGLTGGCNFIDPRPMLEVFRGGKDRFEASRLGEEYARDFFKARYALLAGLPNLEDFWVQERDALRELRATVLSLLGASSEETDALAAYCQEISAIRKSQKDNDYPLPHEAFEPIWSERMYSQRVDVWSTELRRTQEILATDSQVSVVNYTPEILEEMKRALAASEDYLDELQISLKRTVEAVTEDGDPDALASKLKAALTAIAEADNSSNGGKEE